MERLIHHALNKPISTERLPITINFQRAARSIWLTSPLLFCTNVFCKSTKTVMGCCSASSAGMVCVFISAIASSLRPSSINCATFENDATYLPRASFTCASSSMPFGI